jgi:predicted nucleotidyltransferase component of viral defense system
MNESAFKERLKAVAQEKGLQFNLVWKQLLLERLLARVSRSNHHDHFIFKGGMCLAQRIEIGRETTDLDFLMTRLNSEAASVEAAFREIADLDTGDGFRFELQKIEELAQPQLAYPGFRVSLKAWLGKMDDRVQVDIGIGDVVTPVEEPIHLFEYKGKPIFEGEITLLAYPVEAILAEKLETIVYKGRDNSRMKDYHDVLLMLREPGMISVSAAKASITATFQHRNTALGKSILFETDEVERMNALWTRHLIRIGKVRAKLALPDKIADVLAEINAWMATNGIEEVKP